MNPPLTLSDIVLRLLAATVAGALVGWERESHGRPAGLRTTILACVAAAVSMLVSEYLFSQSNDGTGGWRPDPARLGQGILTGIGFLGAGTILRHGNVIRGVTTAASLWFVTVLGLAFGSGLYALGAIGVGLSLATLFVLPRLEKHIPSDWYATLTVTMDLDALAEDQLQSRLKALGLNIKRMELTYDLAEKRKTVMFELRLQRRRALDLPAKVIADLRLCPGVLQVKWA